MMQASMISDSLRSFKPTRKLGRLGEISRIKALKIGGVLNVLEFNIYNHSSQGMCLWYFMGVSTFQPFWRIWWWKTMENPQVEQQKSSTGSPCPRGPKWQHEAILDQHSYESNHVPLSYPKNCHVWWWSTQWYGWYSILKFKFVLFRLSPASRSKYCERWVETTWMFHLWLTEFRDGSRWCTSLALDPAMLRCGNGSNPCLWTLQGYHSCLS